MEILKKLKLLRNNNLPQKEFNSLINFAISTALSFLKIKRSYKYFNLTDDVQSLSDIASEAIVPLFVKAENGKLGIINSYEHWLKPINKEADAAFFVYKIVISRVEQTIPIKLKEQDPFFGKILNTVSTTLRSDEFTRVSYLGTNYITYLNNKNLMNRNIIPNDEFDRLPLQLFLQRQKKLVQGVLSFIEKKTEYFPAIPLNHFIKKIKNVLLSDFPTISTASQHTSDALFIKDMFNKCLSQIKNDILTKYVNTNKLTLTEGNAITKSFEIIITDLQNGGMHGGLFSYVKEQIPELDSDEFYTKYHGIVNHLLRILKKYLLERMNY